MGDLFILREGFLRDLCGWLCVLCGKAFNRELRQGSPSAPRELRPDHKCWMAAFAQIVPIAELCLHRRPASRHLKEQCGRLFGNPILRKLAWLKGWFGMLYSAQQMRWLGHFPRPSRRKS